MKKINLTAKSMAPDFTIDGVSLVNQLSNIEKFYNIPAAIRSTDKKFKTNCFKEVLSAAAPNGIDLLVDEDTNAVQVLDPKSAYMEDEAFDSFIETIDVKPSITTRGFQKQAVFAIDGDDDSYLGDVFKKNIVLTRRAEGGVNINTQLVRQVCTNGMMVPDQQFSMLIRNPQKLDVPTMSAFYQGAGDFSVDTYMKTLFERDGAPVQASLADVFEMQSVLEDLTNDDLANLLYQTERMKAFYASQAIDVDKLARKYLDKLPSGLTMYQALNILTNGAKCMAEDTLENHIKVARFYDPKKMHKLQQIQEFSYSGVPTFSNAEVHAWMGDGLKTAEEVINSFVHA